MTSVPSKVTSISGGSRACRAEGLTSELPATHQENRVLTGADFPLSCP